MDTNTAIQGSIYQVGSAGIEQPFSSLSDNTLQKLHLWIKAFLSVSPNGLA